MASKMTIRHWGLGCLKIQTSNYTFEFKFRTVTFHINSKTALSRPFSMESKVQLSYNQHLHFIEMRLFLPSRLLQPQPSHNPASTCSPIPPLSIYCPEWLRHLTVLWPGPQYYQGRSTTWHADFHIMPRNSSICRGKLWNCPFLLHLYLIQGFLAPFQVYHLQKQQNLVAVSILLW